MMCGLLLLAALCVAPAGAGRILMMPQPFCTSHMRLFYGLAEKLLSSGHQTTTLNWHAADGVAELARPAGLRLIEYSATRFTWVLEAIDRIQWMTAERYADAIQLIAQSLSVGLHPCIALQRNTALMEQLRADNYTLGIVDPHAYPCAWILMNELAIPYVLVSPSMSVYYMDRGVHTPTPFSYVPSISDGQSDVMTLLERAKNIFDHTLFATSSTWYLAAFIQRFYTGWTNTRSSGIMGLFHTHKLFELPRPISNSYITVAMKDRALTRTDEVTEFASDNSSHGTVVFSMTTLAAKEQMPDALRRTIRSSFHRFDDMRFVWRTGTPPNHTADNAHIHYTSWFNQPSLLSHHTMRVLITHGGISSVMEALRHGVPVLTMPMSLDHYSNSLRVTRQGLGVELKKKDVTEVSLVATLNELLTNQRYQKKAATWANMMDMEQNYLLKDPLLWWSNYAEKHGRVLKDRLRPRGEALPSIKYFSVDFMAVLLIGSFSIIVTLL